ncbi:hypothetical protein AAFF_G00258790 [Aldrovandia affinis]|uniref:Uncharacterized protein n=1 Tax=Aldrovandia affinis TaxID=143900 RepID=A0AAD7WTI6_9TELE|nr:hypothetical protein AAFF_G00258790 [Aldrovandia affinis]
MLTAGRMQRATLHWVQWLPLLSLEDEACCPRILLPSVAYEACPFYATDVIYHPHSPVLSRTGGLKGRTQHIGN